MRLTTMQISCPCGSKKDYAQCCQILHEGKAAENALELMRSRYSAYVLKLPEYIIKTTHPASPNYSENRFDWKRSLVRTFENISFHSLEILDFKEKNSLAAVTFTVHFTENGKVASFTERSNFEKFHRRWLYRSGLIGEGRVHQLVPRDPFRILPLSYYGDPILRKVALPVEEVSPEIISLVEVMIETMEACDGGGLAAPQVHHSLRLFIIEPVIEVAPDKYEQGEIEAFINPILSMPSQETWEADEGCLSIPGLYLPIERPKEVTVEYTNLEGIRVKKHVTDWEARAVMHENDHLNGILHIDRLDKETKAKIKPILKAMEKRIHP